MNKLFWFQKTLSAALPKAEVMARLRAAFSDQRALCLSELNAAEDELSFSVKGESILAYNSFRPDVQIQLMETAGGTDVVIHCQIKKAVRIIICVFLSLFALLTAGMVISLIRDQLDPPMLLIPLGMALFAVLLCYFGLRLSSRELIAAARKAIQSHENA